MIYDYFSLNGEILPASEARIGIDNIEYAYGFGVYETIRVNGTPYFLGEHCQRLLDSAKAIDLQHPFSADYVSESVQALLQKLAVASCNVKILLLGGRDEAGAKLYIQCLNPRFPDRKLYKQGVHCITERYERLYPHAKTLNMLPSYLIYRQARQKGAYDALLINDQGCITEGTSTNFFGLHGRTLVSPPEDDILLGVTRDHVIRIAKQNNFEVMIDKVKPYNLDQFDTAFLTSTSSKIMPMRSVDEHIWEQPVTPALAELLQAFSKYLADYRA